MQQREQSLHSLLMQKQLTPAPRLSLEIQERVTCASIPTPYLTFPNQGRHGGVAFLYRIKINYLLIYPIAPSPEKLITKSLS